MGCLNIYKNKSYTDKEFKTYLASGEFQNLVRSGVITIPGVGEFYQVSNTQQDIVDKLTKINELVQPNDSTTYLVNGKEVRRVTSVIKAKQKNKFGSAVDQATLDIWEEARETGTKLHAYKQDIVNQLTGGTKLVDQNKLTTNERLVYDNLSVYITDLISLKIKGGSKFLAEVRIADIEKNLAGTVDLIEVTPDGKINIFDYKTRSKEKLHKIKLDEYSEQLKSYADILEKVTGADVLQRRIIPIKVTRDKDNNIKVDIRTQEPVAFEKTGIEELDILLDKFNARLEYLESIQVAPKD